MEFTASDIGVLAKFLSLALTSSGWPLLPVRRLDTDISKPAEVWIVAPVVISTCTVITTTAEYATRLWGTKHMVPTKTSRDYWIYLWKQPNRMVSLTGGAPGAREKSNRRTSMASAVVTCVTRETNRESNELPQNLVGTPYTDFVVTASCILLNFLGSHYSNSLHSVGTRSCSSVPQMWQTCPPGISVGLHRRANIYPVPQCWLVSDLQKKHIYGNLQTRSSIYNTDISHSTNAPKKLYL